MSVVVDTSVWIDFLAGRPTPALEEALAAATVVLSPVVAAELVSGVRTTQARAQIEDLLIDLPLHVTPLAHWLGVGDLRRLLAGKGVTISTPDAHVAQCALDLDGVLLSHDEIFARLVEHVPLRLTRG